MSKYLKTSKAIAVKCKCGSIVAATLIYGGIEIDADFTQTMAEVIHRGGGEILIMDSKSDDIRLSECKCGKEESNG